MKIIVRAFDHADFRQNIRIIIVAAGYEFHCQILFPNKSGPSAGFEDKLKSSDFALRTLNEVSRMLKELNSTFQLSNDWQELKESLEKQKKLAPPKSNRSTPTSGYHLARQLNSITFLWQIKRANFNTVMKDKQKTNNQRRK